MLLLANGRNLDMIRCLPPPDGLHGALNIFGRSYAVALAPVAVSATAVAGGGTFAAATYYWKVTALGPWGESAPSNEVSAAVALNGHCDVVWGKVPGATGYKVYRGTAPAGENVYYTVADVAIYSDTNAGSTGGTPTVNYTVDLPDDDAAVADANGWTKVADGVGTTAARPLPTPDAAGESYLDTTLGYVVVCDGKAWRNPLTGAVV